MFLSVGLILSLQCKFLVLMSLSFKLLHFVSLTLSLVHADLFQSIRTHCTCGYCLLTYRCHFIRIVVSLKYGECSGSTAAGLSYMVDSDDFLHVGVTGAGLMNTADVHNSGEQLVEFVDVECSESCRSSCSGHCRLQ